MAKLCEVMLFLTEVLEQTRKQVAGASVCLFTFKKIKILRPFCANAVVARTTAVDVIRHPYQVFSLTHIVLVVWQVLTCVKKVRSLVSELPYPKGTDRQDNNEVYCPPPIPLFFSSYTVF